MNNFTQRDEATGRERHEQAQHHGADESRHAAEGQGDAGREHAHQHEAHEGADGHAEHHETGGHSHEHDAGEHHTS